MHRVLLIHEIQLCIFNQIPFKQTLNALARTCQAFSETALDVLWSDLDCFPRLIQCMPEDLWKRELKREGCFLTLCRPISSSDWAVLQKYTRRVRYVRQGPNRDFYGTFWGRLTLDDAFLLALCAASAPTPLLPNLKSLKW
ncbi:hypothetical protein BJ138DRAFT_991489, partial [Hygrophoropsis aurantiaca]